MASELQFVMHPDDEALFAQELLREPELMFIDGPRWPGPAPLATRDLGQVGSYCIAWSPSDLPALGADYIATCNDWYCNTEYATIQFLRSTLDDEALRAGRIAYHYFPADFDPGAASAITRRFNRLRRYIKGRFHNFALVARDHPDCVFNAMWVGPHASEWLRQSPDRWVSCPAPAVLAPGLVASHAWPPMRHSG